ncbi:hypothetical protein AAGG52_20650 [Bacillus licheniformis]
MEHDWGAFMNRDLVVEPASAEGSLKNLSFAVKDVFAVEGHTNAAGSPDWLRLPHLTVPLPAKTASLWGFHSSPAVNRI